MDDNAPKENPPADFNKLDLSQLQGFSFGTQWTQEKPGAANQGDRGAGGERFDRRDGGGAPDRRDRRSFRRPAGPGEGGGPAGAGPGNQGAPARREFSGDRPPRQGGGGEYRGAPAGPGGPRREGAPMGAGGDRGPRYGQGNQGYGGRGAPQDRGPYESPFYTATYYPEDTSFNTLVQTIRKSCRTVELFEIARTVVAKNDRFVVVVAHRPSTSAPLAAPSGASEPTASNQPRPVFYVSVPDGIPFESDEAAVSHVLGKHLDKFFDTAEVEVDPPKGNFLVINRCGLTGELLGPPNYHRYNQIVQQHHAAKIGSRMVLEAYRSRIETVRDPEIVNQWLAKMKKTVRYTWKLAGVAAPVAPVASSPAEALPAAEDTGASAEESPPSAPVPSVVPTFDNLEEARLFLLSQARDKVVRTTETARFHGKLLETMTGGEIRRAVEGALDRQRRFPLDTANALRGRLRREHFTIFKKGSKGVSYVCAVKRKFRVPDQTFADSIGALISFIETSPMVRASELASKFLGISRAPAVRPALPADVSSPAPAAGDVPTGEAPMPIAVEPSVQKTEDTLTIEERAKLSRLQGDLMWLVREGYVTEFIDGRLFAPPPMVEARKKEIEGEEHDPENFPEAPPAPVAEMPLATPLTEEIPAEPQVAEVAAVPAVPELDVPAAEPEAPQAAVVPVEDVKSEPPSTAPAS